VGIWSVSTAARQLRDAVIAYSLTALRLFARLPIAPAPLQGIGLTDAAGAHAAFDIAAALIVAATAYGLTRIPAHPARS
jgi:hypothetical protein